MTEVSIDAGQLRLYAEASRKAGTQDKFIDLALEWADKAQAHVEKVYAQLEQHQWHSVEDGLPETDTYVLGWGDFWEDVQRYHFSLHDGVAFWDHESSITHHLRSHHPHHWMPLPTPPMNDTDE